MATHTAWYQQSENAIALDAIRALLAAGEDRVVIAIGATLPAQTPHHQGIAVRLPSHAPAPFPRWPDLVARMDERLRGRAAYRDVQRQLSAFVRGQSPFDLAELFRAQIGPQGTLEFLRDQYAPGDPPLAGLQDHLPPAYEALVHLPARELFTTTYDALIELAYRIYAPPTAPTLRISTSVADYLAGQETVSWRHLIRINGSVNAPDSLVFTRTDVARTHDARTALVSEWAMRQAPCVLIGYEVGDPTLTLLLDEFCACDAAARPPVYVVQGEPDPVAEEYLRALQVYPIGLGSWEHLAEFLMRINPRAQV
jgi:hypothetical protein